MRRGDGEAARATTDHQRHSPGKGILFPPSYTSCFRPNHSQYMPFRFMMYLRDVRKQKPVFWNVKFDSGRPDITEIVVVSSFANCSIHAVFPMHIYLVGFSALYQRDVKT